MRQTKNAIHMLSEAYLSVYRHALQQGMSNIRLSVLGNNLLKALLIAASVGTACAATIMDDKGEKSLLDVNPTIQEDTLTDDLVVEGNLGHEMARMLNAAREQDGTSTLKKMLFPGYNYQGAVDLLNSADFHNVTTYGLSGDITLNSISVQGGRARLAANQNSVLTVTGNTNATMGYIKFDGRQGEVNLNGQVKFSGTSVGVLDNKVTMSQGLVVEDHATVDLLQGTFTGDMLVKSKGVTSKSDLTQLEQQYGLWGWSADIVNGSDPVSFGSGGLRSTYGTSTVKGNVTVDAGSLIVHIGDEDYLSSQVKDTTLNIEGNLDAKNGSEIYVTSRSGSTSKLNINGDLNASSGSKIVVGGFSNDYPAAQLKANNINLNPGTSLMIYDKSSIFGNITADYSTEITGPFGGRNNINGNVTLKGNGGNDDLGEYKGADLDFYGEMSISGNLTNDGGMVHVDSSKGNNLVNTTLTVEGDYYQNSRSTADDTKLKVRAGQPQCSATMNVNGNFTATGGSVDISRDKTDLADLKEDLIEMGFADFANTAAQGNSVLNVGGNFTVSGTADLEVAEGGTLNVKGNAEISSIPTGTASPEDLAEMNGAYPGLLSDNAAKPNLVLGKANFKKNLTLSGYGLLAYGKTATIKVDGMLYTDKANLVTLKQGATFIGTKTAMLNSAENAKNDNIAEGTFNVDATSTVSVTGVETTDTATIKAIRQQLFSTDTGILDFAGATVLDAPDGDQVGYNEAKKYEGTSVLAEKTVTGVSGEVTGSNSWGSAVLAAGSQTMTVTSGGVSLNNAKDGKFVATSDGALGSVDLAEGAQLSLNSSGALENITGSGTVKVGNNAAGTVNANAVTVKTLSVEHGSNLNVASTLSLEEGTLDGGSSLKASTVTLTGTGKTFSILGGSSLTANMLALNGNTLFADPSWNESASVVYSSGFGTDAANSNLDGDMVIGQNSGLYHGTTLNVGQFGSYLASTLSATGITALGYVDKSFTVGSGSSLTIDGSLTSDTAAKTDNTVVIAKNSTLVVTGNALSDGAAVKFATAGNVTNDGDVLLKDVDVAKGSTYTVFSNAAVSGSGTYSFANALFTGSSDSTGVVTAAYNADKASAYLSDTDSSIASAVKSYAENGGTFKALSFLNQSLSLGSTSADAVRSKAIGQSLNSAARFSVLAGGIQNAEMASRATYNAIEERLGFGSATVSRLAAIDGTHASIWAQPLYGYQKSKGFDGGKSGDYGVKSKLYGVTLGSDVSFGNFVVGGSFSIGKGDSKSRGDYAYTKNDYDFFGVAAYGSYAINNFLLMADVGFTKVNGDVDQYNAAGTLKGDVDTMVFTLGFKGKYTFKLSALDIAPHAGIRYSYYDIGSDNIKYGKEELKNKSLDAKVLYLPVGVAFSKDVKVNNWSIRSVCDLELIAATGDTDVTSKVVASGVELSAKSDVVDKFSYSGKLGVNFEKGNFGLGLGYRYLGSKNVNNHNVYLNARYTF